MSLGSNLGRRTEAMTREPGDLPNANNVHGRGVLVCRSMGRFAARLAMRSPTPCPQLIGAHHVSKHNSGRHVWRAIRRPSTPFVPWRWARAA